MPKKPQKQSLSSSKKAIIAAIIITLTAPAAYYFIPWSPNHHHKKPYSPDRNTHSIIPDISDTSPIIQDVFEKNNIKCITTYNITTTLPIYIKRYYPNENRTEYLILRPIDAYYDNVTDLYQLIQNSKAHIGAFEPQVMSMYSSKVNTRYRLLSQNKRMNKEPDYLTLGIWYRKEGENSERLIGKVTVDPRNQSEEAKAKGIPTGVYGSYFIGDPAYTQVRGVACISFEALVNHLIYKGQIKKNILLVIDKKNIKSSRIASKLHFRRKEAHQVFPKKEWHYPVKIENSYLYNISVKKWKEYNWTNKEVTKDQVPVTQHLRATAS